VEVVAAAVVGFSGADILSAVVQVVGLCWGQAVLWESVSSLPGMCVCVCFLVDRLLLSKRAGNKCVSRESFAIFRDPTKFTEGGRKAFGM